MEKNTSYLDIGLFLPLDLFFAERILVEEKDKREEHVAFFALLLSFSRQGHLALAPEKMPEILQMHFKMKCSEIESLMQMVQAAVSSLSPSMQKHIYKQEGLFYLQKNWICEQQIAAHILRLLKGVVTEIPLIDKNIDSLSEQQRLAITHANHYALSLLFGGPGTGKTYTAAQLVKTFLFSDEKQEMRIVLSAPTGKAVAQLDAYLRRFICDEKRIRSVTLHALLGLKTEKDLEKQSTPIFADMIIVDECSMIDAQLFARLLASVVEGSRLILIGDPDQLPSVEAGSIFSDLISAAQDNFSIPITQLSCTLRSEREEILCFSQYIRTGQSAKAIEMLRENASNGVKWLDLNLQDRLKGSVYQCLWKMHNIKFPSFFIEEPDPAPLMRSLDAFRLLSCMRQGCFGVDAINLFFAEQFLKELKANCWWVAPILITQSDYGLELYNGDAGLLIRRMDFSSSLREIGQQDYAFFPDRNMKQNMRKIPALALPAFEFGYCLSVHKSQGSEYDEVFILIPKGSEFFGREILYTAVTRTRQIVTCAASLDSIEKVIQNNARKISGLSARLKRELQKESQSVHLDV